MPSNTIGIEGTRRELFADATSEKKSKNSKKKLLQNMFSTNLFWGGGRRHYCPDSNGWCPAVVGNSLKWPSLGLKPHLMAMFLATMPT